ncbi:MAG TPA: IMP cyclohydrolase [Victivallales bacterium]|nr:IMP cyclohydrolase [Victivallales bacterium]HPO90975.1 IMP cyclohydrolase [Victivallales bacterium]HRR06812.1 IMP cyclohydrolase [Victivallales bacterium]HRU01667.1 IMP cyclohydrolase [Victivallales bacterium]
MYLGRIVAAGMTKSGLISVLYRVSSRSFPNREAKIMNNSIAIIPKAGFEKDIFINPYIAYNCIKFAGDWVIATNGSQTDPIAEKIANGMSARDAFAISMLALDYEKDKYNTPRIGAAANAKQKKIILGIIRKDYMQIAEFDCHPGKLYYVSTYEHNSISEEHCDRNYEVKTADEACSYIMGKGIFANFANPVTAATAIFINDKFELAVT